MESILIGFMIALLVGLVCALVWIVVDGEYSSKTSKNTLCIGVVITILTWVVVSALLIDSDKTTYRAWTQKYISQKQLIEESLDNEKLSGLERVELVKQANELNAGLIDKQFLCVKWYSFAMDDKVLELEPVSLK